MLDLRSALEPFLPEGMMLRSLLAAVALCLFSSAALAQASVRTYPLAWPTTNVSSTITSGGAFQSIDNANLNRKGFQFSNTNASDNCFIWFAASSSGATTATSVQVKAGVTVSWFDGVIPSDKIWVTCANTNDTFYAAVYE